MKTEEIKCLNRFEIGIPYQGEPRWTTQGWPASKLDPIGSAKALSPRE